MEQELEPGSEPAKKDPYWWAWLAPDELEVEKVARRLGADLSRNPHFKCRDVWSPRFRTGPLSWFSPLVLWDIFLLVLFTNSLLWYSIPIESDNDIRVRWPELEEDKFVRPTQDHPGVNHGS